MAPSVAQGRRAVLERDQGGVRGRSAEIPRLVPDPAGTSMASRQWLVPAERVVLL